MWRQSGLSFITRIDKPIVVTNSFITDSLAGISDVSGNMIK